MPHVVVKLCQASPNSRRVRLAQNITKDVMDVLHYGEESVSVAFEEVEPGDWAAKVYQTDIVGNAEKLYKKPGYTM